MAETTDTLTVEANPTWPVESWESGWGWNPDRWCLRVRLPTGEYLAVYRNAQNYWVGCSSARTAFLGISQKHFGMASSFAMRQWLSTGEQAEAYKTLLATADLMGLI
jgi:hypothetical protein